MNGMVRRVLLSLAIAAALALVCGQGLAQPACTGDCDGNQEVSMAELIMGLAMDLGNAVDGCGVSEVDDLLLAINNAADQCGTNAAALNCRNDGGTFYVSDCCTSAPDFPNLCSLGGCTCAPEFIEPKWKCNCGDNRCFNGEHCVI